MQAFQIEQKIVKRAGNTEFEMKLLGDHETVSRVIQAVHEELVGQFTSAREDIVVDFAKPNYGIDFTKVREGH